MAAGVGKKYLLPALRTAFPAYGQVADQLISAISQSNEESGMRVKKSIILYNFQIGSDPIINVNLNPGYDYFGWLSQIACSY